ncbi:MAG: hypothetical protein ACRD01_10945 [Terriglobales bacterium]
MRWLHLGETPPEAPFLRQEARARVRAGAPAAIALTSVAALLGVAEELRPCGLIFHISRCGSTLLANALRAFHGTTVISEPQPVSALLEAPDYLVGAVRAYGRRHSADSRRLVLKLTSGNVHWLPTFRRLWPDAPCLLLIRSPVEVMVSCLKGPPGWLRTAPPIAAREELCARGLAEYMTAGESGAGPGLRVMDYEQLDLAGVTAVAEFFGLGPGSADTSRLERALCEYSKPQQCAARFCPDSASKRAAATPAVLAAAELWAQPVYKRLLAETCR